MKHHKNLLFETKNIFISIHLLYKVIISLCYVHAGTVYVLATWDIPLTFLSLPSFPLVFFSYNYLPFTCMPHPLVSLLDSTYDTNKMQYLLDFLLNLISGFAPFHAEDKISFLLMGHQDSFVLQ